MLANSEETKKKYRTWPVKIMAWLLLLVFVAPLITACGDDEETVKPAQYGDYGENIALTLAHNYPYRKAFTAEEAAAGAYVKSELQKLGYTVEEQVVTSMDGVSQSLNYIVRIPGEGFMSRDSFGDYSPTRKTVIIGAHYDNAYSVADAAQYPDYDGIQDNACGIGCLLTIAKEIKGQNNGYDVILVAFGAGSANYAGARAFVSSMTQDEINRTDCMYCIESIYAGDKLYASAGLSSLQDGRKYSYRRKLYESYDVAYDNMLSSLNGVELYYNMSGIIMDVNGDGRDDIFREVTLTTSDYVPFDQAGIPIVFFESYDYDFSELANMKETKNLNLQDNGGLIRHSSLDSSTILAESLDEERLSQRINNTAFIVINAVAKGSHNSVTNSQYEAGETLAPTTIPKKETSSSEE